MRIPKTELIFAVMRPTKKGGSWTSTIERVRSYSVEFFGAMKMDDIGPSDFERYWLWRKENYAKKIPSNATLGRERTSIRSLFNFAVKLGHITKIPDSTPPKNNGERRPTFTDQEWKAIVKAMDGWLTDGATKATSKDRILARPSFLILVNSGLRIGELRKLKWGDLRPVEDGKDIYVVAEVRGKTGGPEVVCQKSSRRLFNDLIDLRCSELEKEHPNDPDMWKPKRAEPVFCHPNGTEIQTFKRSFQSLLKFAKVPIMKNGSARTL